LETLLLYGVDILVAPAASINAPSDSGRKSSGSTWRASTG